MIDLIEQQAADVVVLLKTKSDEPIRDAAAEDVRCLLLLPGASEWKTEVLTPASWRRIGEGAYFLRIQSDDLLGPGTLAVLLQPLGKTPGPVVLERFRVLPRRYFEDTEIETTEVVGKIGGPAEWCKAKLQVTARPVTTPCIVRGNAIAVQNFTAETNERGVFRMHLPTGAQMQLHIPAIGLTKTIIVPHSPAGLPVNVLTL